jgi:hypothetical protein
VSEQSRYGFDFLKDQPKVPLSPMERRMLPNTPPAPQSLSPLPPGSEARKEVPIASGCIDYFPAALAQVAHLSWAGNEKHNPGEPLHDARAKSQDDADCLQRHFLERGKWDTIVTADGRTLHVRHSAAVAWRALRILQKECEADGASLAPGARL